MSLVVLFSNPYLNFFSLPDRNKSLNFSLIVGRRLFQTSNKLHIKHLKPSDTLGNKRCVKSFKKLFQKLRYYLTLCLVLTHMVRRMDYIIRGNTAETSVLSLLYANNVTKFNPWQTMLIHKVKTI